jgi:hypothetical protein
MPEMPFPLPLTMVAVLDAAELVRATWVEMAQSARYIAGPSTGAYTRGLTQEGSLLYPYEGDPLRALVQNLAPHAALVEFGHPSFHLPSVIHWPTRTSRRSKRGIYYLVVPFRHFAYRTGAGITPMAERGMMPRRIYQVAKRLQPGQRLTAEPSSGRAVHAPGMTPYVPRYAPNVRPGYQHASMHEGMRRTGTRGANVRYLTFRTLAQDSPGWHIPAQPGRFIARDVRAQMAPVVRRLIDAAVRADVTAYLQAQR